MGFSSASARLRLVLELPGVGVIRQLIFEREAAAEHRFVHRQALMHNVRVLDPEKLSQSLENTRNRETFFILGAGTSVNALLPEEIEEIGRQCSVGINTWGIHSFVPDMFALESVPWVGDGKDFSRALSLLRREDILGRRPALLVLRPRTGDNHADLHKIPRELFGRVLYYGRVSPTTRESSKLRQDARKLLHTVGTKYPGVFLDSGASVVRMMGLGIAMGFRKIVLVGVDLNSAEYFWENNPDYDLGSLPLPPVNNQRSSGHETTISAHRAFSVVEMVKILAEAFEANFGARVFVSSSKSELAKYLPKYPWVSGAP